MHPKFSLFAKSAFAFSICALTGLSATAQILDRIERRAKERANRRVEQKIDEKVDKAVDRAFDSAEDSAKNNSKDGANGEDRSGAMSRAFMSGVGMSDGADVEAEYTFHHALDMRFETFDRKGKKENEMDITMMLNKERPISAMYTQVEGRPGTVIIDPDKKLMYTLADSDGQKMGIAMSFDGIDEEEADDEEVTFTATGETRTISGYHCKAYLAENAGDEKTRNTIWMTEDAELNWMEIYARMSESGTAQSPAVPSTYPSGTMIMMESVSERNGEKTLTTVREIRMNDKNTVSTEGYRFITMGDKR